MLMCVCVVLFLLTVADAGLRGEKFFENITDILIERYRMGQMLTRVSRYSITLLVSLNNRIYFRDHPGWGNHINSIHILRFPTNRSCCSATTSRRFAQVGSPVHATTMGHSLQLNTIPHAIDLERAKGDAVSSIRSEPR